MAIDPLAARSAANIPAAAPVARPPVVHPDAAAGSDAGAAAAGTKGSVADGDQDLSFWDVLDIVNPLQHIPIVGSVYRAVTGDEIKPAMQIGGDILYGGVIGGMASIANAVLQEASGKDLGGHIMAGLGFGDEGGKNAPVQVAAAASPQAPAQTAQMSATQAPPTAAAAQQQASARPTASAAPPPPPPGGLTKADLIAALQGGGGGAQQTMPGMPAGGMPTGGISGGLAAAAGQKPQGFDPAAVMNSGHVPNKMPRRDAMLASTMPHGSQTSNLERAGQADRTGPVLPQLRTGPSAQAQAARQAQAAQQGQTGQQAQTGLLQATQQTTHQAAGASTQGSGNIAPSRDAMADVMMRNLAKYQADKRAQNHTMRTSG
jgi:hypothetical protein